VLRWWSVAQATHRLTTGWFLTNVRNLEESGLGPNLVYHPGICLEVLTKTTSNLSGELTLCPIFGLWTYPVLVTQCCTIQCHKCYASGRLDKKPAGCRIKFTIPVETASIHSDMVPAGPQPVWTNCINHRWRYVGRSCLLHTSRRITLRHRISWVLLIGQLVK
jgi:hypothetical protein